MSLESYSSGSNGAENEKKVEVSVVTASNLIASGGALAVARRQATLAGMRGSVQRLWVVV